MLAFFSAGAQTIPVDPAVRTGRLPNGFTYYIRHNAEPQRHVELYLVNKVGSILEDEDQRGLAHFMEHMNFNGTAHFPGNQLVHYLQKAGVRFGADLNAYTNFDETVYQLPVSTDDPALVTGGLQIMRDWAQEALLDPIEIEKERGVVREEERLGKGVKDRLSRSTYPVLFNHSRYAERLPIGLDSILVHFPPAAIRRFHQDWYRPDLQALIVVGDVNVDSMEQRVKTSFGTLKNPAQERAREKYPVPLTGKRQFLVATDPEMTATQLQVVLKHRYRRAITTEADYKAALVRELFNSLLSTRIYTETSRQSDPAYVSVNAGIGSLIDDLDAMSFSVTAKKGQLQAAFGEGYKMLERVRRYGFAASELDRAKTSYLRTIDEELREKDKTRSISYAREYQELFLEDNAAPGIDWEAAYVHKHIGEVTLEDMRQLMGYYSDKDEDIIVMAPDAERAGLPDSATVMQWKAAVKGAAMTAYVDASAGRVLMAVRPTPGTVVARDSIPALGVTTLTLGNGIKVVMKPTDFENDRILFEGYSPGGTSLYADSDFDAAANAAALMGSFGVDTLDAVQLRQLLNGKVASVGTSINERTQVVSGSAARTDLETALQLLYLKMTRPRMDTLIYHNIIARTSETLANRGANPEAVFADTVNAVLGNHSYRAMPFSPARLQRIELEKAYRIYKERYADASGFTFVFVGNFTVDSLAPLLATYLGSLPALHRNDKARDPGDHIPGGQWTKKVHRGKENKATVRLVISGDYDYNAQNNLSLRALSDVLQIKVLQHLREDEGEVYSPQVQVSYGKYPKSRYAFTIAFGCAPTNVDHLVEDVRHEMTVLRDKGPEQEDVDKFKTTYLKQLEPLYRQNNYWLSYLVGVYENGEDPLLMKSVQQRLDKISVESLRQSAKQYLSGSNRISFELLPEHLR
jgi:zinc protease